jgi:hypothetical protein
MFIKLHQLECENQIKRKGRAILVNINQVNTILPEGGNTEIIFNNGPYCYLAVWEAFEKVEKIMYTPQIVNMLPGYKCEERY